MLNRIADICSATIAGSLYSNGRVIVLAPNGTISIAGTANINTQGFTASTVNESDNGMFLATGNLANTATSTGTIAIGGTSAPTVTGNFEAWGGTISAFSLNVTGNAVLHAIGSGTALVLGNSSSTSSDGGNVVVTGNFGAYTNNGSITQYSGNVTVGDDTLGTSATSNSTATFSTGTGAISLANADLAFVAMNTTGSANITEIDRIVLNNSTVGGNLTIVAGGLTNNTAIQTVGAVAIGNNASFATGTINSTGSFVNGTVGNSSISIGNNSTIVGTVTAVATTNSAIGISVLGNLTTGNLTSGSAASGNKAGVTITATGGALKVNGAIAAAGGAVTLTGNTVVISNTITTNASTGASVTLRSTAGDITVGNVITATGSFYGNATSGNIALNSNISATTVSANTLSGNGSITEASSAVITTSTANGTNTFQAGTGNISLTGANVFAADSVIQFLTATDASITSTKNLVLGTTNTTGNVTLNAYDATTGGQTVVLGTGSGTATQNIAVRGTLTVTTNAGAITDNDPTAFNIYGGLNLTTNNGTAAGADITLDAANYALSPRVSFGQANILAGTSSVNITETTSLNLGTVVAGNVTAKSLTGSIIDSGNLTIASNTILTVSAGSIVLDSIGNSLGTVTLVGGTDDSLYLGGATTLGSSSAVTGNLTLTSGSGVAISLAGGTYGNLTIASGGAVSFAANTTSVTGNLTLAASGATTDTGNVTVAGTATFNNSGNVTLDGTANDFATVVLNTTGSDTTIYDANNLTVSGTSTGNVTVKAGAGSVASTWSLILGNISAASLIATAANGGAGNSGTITQTTGTSIHSEGETSFTTSAGAITLTNANNSFGNLSLSAGANITVTESGTMKIGKISNTNNLTTLTSSTGSIIENQGVNVVANSGTTKLYATSGNIALGNLTHTTGSTSGGLGAVTANASGDIAVFATSITGSSGGNLVVSGGNISLGAVSAASLTATATTNYITQSGALNIYGNATFAAAGVITLSNVSNSFGLVSLTTTSATANVTITENGTLKLGVVSMGNVSSTTGFFTANSVNGNIVDAGTGIYFGGNPTATGSGNVTLSAANGSIVLNDSTTSIATSTGVTFNALNTTFALQGNIVLGSANTTSATGNLTVISSTGSISQLGNLTASGDSIFKASSGNIFLNTSGLTNKFGSVQFTGNQVSITQASDMVIQTGSWATGVATFITTGNITTTNAKNGGVISLSGANSYFISTGGNITVAGSTLSAINTVTFNATGTVDLSAVNLTNDLNSKTPTVNAGVTYKTPI